MTALSGAEILCYPTAIGWQFDEGPEVDAAQHDAWETVQRAHAIANGVFVAAVNRVGQEGEIRFWGQSFVGRPLRPRARPRLGGRRGDAPGRMRARSGGTGAARLALPARSAHRCLRGSREALPGLTPATETRRGGVRRDGRCARPAGVPLAGRMGAPPGDLAGLAAQPRRPGPDASNGRVDGFVAIVRALHGREHVHILVADEAMEDAARRRLAGGGVDADRGVDFPHIPTNDAWLRDTGPIFVVRDTPAGRERAARRLSLRRLGREVPPVGSRRRGGAPDRAALRRPALRSGFRARGRLHRRQRPWGRPHHRVVPAESEPGTGPQPRPHGGAPALLAGRDARAVALRAGIAGDDTDGHVDDIARFVEAGTVAAAVAEPSDDANYAPLAENLRRLRGMRDQDGRPLAVIELPMPPAHTVDGLRCPASYANFYLANGVALVPTFGAKSRRPRPRHPARGLERAGRRRNPV